MTISPQNAHGIDKKKARIRFKQAQIINDRGATQPAWIIVNNDQNHPAL